MHRAIPGAIATVAVVAFTVGAGAATSSSEPIKFSLNDCVVQEIAGYDFGSYAPVLNCDGDSEEWERAGCEPSSNCRSDVPCGTCWSMGGEKAFVDVPSLSEFEWSWTNSSVSDKSSDDWIRFGISFDDYEPWEDKKPTVDCISYGCGLYPFDGAYDPWGQDNAFSSLQEEIRRLIDEIAYLRQELQESRAVADRAADGEAAKRAGQAGGVAEALTLAIVEWQKQHGLEPTGILTDGQALLMAEQTRKGSGPVDATGEEDENAGLVGDVGQDDWLGGRSYGDPDNHVIGMGVGFETGYSVSYCIESEDGDEACSCFSTEAPGTGRDADDIQIGLSIKF